MRHLEHINLFVAIKL